MDTRLGAVALKGGYSVLLSAPDSYWSAAEDQRSQQCNGCGTKGIFSLVPDSNYGVDIQIACDIHDWCYWIGQTLDDKNQADREFLNNMLRLIEKAPSASWILLGPLLTRLRRRRALKYYWAVHYMGGPAFWSKSA